MGAIITAAASLHKFYVMMPRPKDLSRLFFKNSLARQKIASIHENCKNRVSEQLPCRSAEVKFFSVFLCQRCREIWREILVKFSVLCFPGFGCARENSTKISRQRRCEKRKISRKLHSAGGAALIESSIAVEDAVENRGLYRVFVSRLF